MVKDFKEFRSMIDDIREKFKNAKTPEERYIYRSQLKDAIAYCKEEVEKYGVILDRRNSKKSYDEETEERRRGK